jgi:hypothetical protein
LPPVLQVVGLDALYQGCSISNLVFARKFMVISSLDLKLCPKW